LNPFKFDCIVFIFVGISNVAIIASGTDFGKHVLSTTRELFFSLNMKETFVSILSPTVPLTDLEVNEIVDGLIAGNTQGIWYLASSADVVGCANLVAVNI
jgi:hypothetical protein